MKRSIILYLLICSVGFIFFGCSKKDEPVPIQINDPTKVELVNIQDSLNYKVPIADLLAQFPVDSFFGKTYQGGLIFFVSERDSFGLIAAPNDQGFVPWENPLNWTPIGANSTFHGGGKINTTTIVNILGSGDYAAYLCDTLTLNGYNDWFLPNQAEFSSIYENLHVKGLGSFSTGAPQYYYWTSRERDNSTAYAFFIVGGSVVNSFNKSYTRSVRAARIFVF